MAEADHLAEQVGDGRPDARTVPVDWAGVSPLSRAPRTVLGELLPGVLDTGAATRILCMVRAREASSLRGLAHRVRPEATGRP